MCKKNYNFVYLCMFVYTGRICIAIFVCLSCPVFIGRFYKLFNDMTRKAGISLRSCHNATAQFITRISIIV